MEGNLLASIMRISDILRRNYGLTLEEAAECINAYVDITFLSEKIENIEFFLSTSLNAWAEEMYYNYTRNAFPSKEKRISPEDGPTIPCDETYMEWLRGFTKNTLGFSDNNWDECPESLSQYDFENIGKLRCLFCEIANYVYGRRISPEVIVHCCSLFHVKYGNSIFMVGSDGGRYYVEEVKDKNIESVIPFEAIMTEMRNAESKLIDFGDPCGKTVSDGANATPVRKRKQSGCCRYNVF